MARGLRYEAETETRISRRRLRRMGMLLWVVLWVWTLMSGTALAAAAPTGVRILNQEVVVLPVENQRLQFVVLTTLENRGKAAEQEIYLALPEGAEKFTPIECWGGHEMRDGGVVERAGIGPGEKRVLAYSYLVPYEGNRPVVNYPVSYLSESVQILVPPERLAVEAKDFLTQSEVLQFNGRNLRRFTRLNLHPGEQWPLHFTLLDGKALPQQVDKSVHPSGLPVVYHDYQKGVNQAIFNILFVVVVLLLGFIGVRTSMWRAQVMSRRNAAETLRQQRETLLNRLVEVERAHRRQEISDEEYQRRRQQLEEALLPIYHLEQDGQQPLRQARD